MTAYLTKKWKDGKLKTGWYYVSCYINTNGMVLQTIAYANHGTIAMPIQEILEKVPPYQEFMEIKRKIKLKNNRQIIGKVKN